MRKQRLESGSFCPCTALLSEMKALLRSVAKKLKNLVLSLSKAMNKEYYKYNSGGGGKSLRLRKLKELDQFCLMSIRFRNIMNKKNLKYPAIKIYTKYFNIVSYIVKCNCI